MTKTILIVLFVLLLLPLSSTNSNSNQNQLTCLDRDEVENLLKVRYRAKIVGMGVVSNGSLALLYIEPGDDFHIIIIPPNNTDAACPLLWGESWEWDSKYLDMST